MEDRRIFIIILSFNSRDFIIRCLKSIIQSRIKNLRIVVVDNGSTDESVSLIKAKFPKVEVIENKENLGFARGNNRGIRLALKNGADYIFLLNPDATIEKETIKTLLKVMENDASLGIVGPKIYSQNGKIWSCGGETDEKRFTAGLIGFGEKDYPQSSVGVDVDFVSGTAMFIRRKVFEDIGLLPVEYFLYYEDVDFCLRTKKAGFKIYFTPDSIVYHDWSSSVGKQSPMKDYFMARNHLLFVERHAPFWVKLHEFLRMPKTLYEHNRDSKKFALLGVRDYFLRRFGKRDYWS